MYMMLTNNLPNATQFAAFRKIRTNFPNNFSALFANDCKDIAFSCIPDNIIRMKTFITSIVPFVWT